MYIIGDVISTGINQEIITKLTKDAEDYSAADTPYGTSKEFQRHGYHKYLPDQIYVASGPLHG